MGENFHELVKIQHFVEKTLTDCQSVLWDGSYTVYTSTNFRRKTLSQKVKVFTRKIFRLYGMYTIILYINVHVYEIMPNM